jgi:hypothetical protein
MRKKHLLRKSSVLDPLHLRPRVGNLLLADVGIVQEIEIYIIQTKLYQYIHWKAEYLLSSLVVHTSLRSFLSANAASDSFDLSQCAVTKKLERGRPAVHARSALPTCAVLTKLADISG